MKNSAQDSIKTSDINALGFHALELYIQVVELGNFSAVAVRYDVAVSSISRQIKKIEEALGVALLLKHGSAKLMPTEAGLRFYDMAQSILLSLSDAQNELKSLTSQPGGLIQVGCSTPVGEILIAQMIPKFLSQNPGMKIDLVMSNKILDVVAERLDLFICLGSPAGEAKVIRKLGNGHNGVYASLEYLEKYGEPQTPEELVDHNCLIYRDDHVSYDKWVYRKGIDTGSVKISGTLSLNTSNSMLNMLAKGVGVCMAQSWMVTSYVKQGKIKKLFPDYDYVMLPFMREDVIYAVFPQVRGLPLKTRMLIDFIVSEFEADSILLGGD